MKEQNDILSTVVRKAIDGNSAAQAILYEQFARKMFNICIRMTANQKDAEDILQNAYLNAFQNLHQLKSSHQFETWLRTIVIRECLKFLKQKKYWAALPDEQLIEDEQDADAWYMQVPLKDIHEAIKKLPDGCREIFTLYVLEDYSHSDIANLLGCSISTSKSQYHRAKKLLRELIRKKQ